MNPINGGERVTLGNGGVDFLAAQVALDLSRADSDPGYERGEPLWEGFDLRHLYLAERTLTPDLSKELLRAMGRVANGELGDSQDTRKRMTRILADYESKLPPVTA